MFFFLLLPWLSSLLSMDNIDGDFSWETIRKTDHFNSGLAIIITARGKRMNAALGEVENVLGKGNQRWLPEGGDKLHSSDGFVSCYSWGSQFTSEMVK